MPLGLFAELRPRGAVVGANEPQEDASGGLICFDP